MAAVLVLQLLIIALLSRQALVYRRQLKTARKQLESLASNDNEIICVLEASNTPLAKKLLEAAKEKPKLPARRPRTDKDNDFSVILSELKGYNTDVMRLKALTVIARKFAFNLKQQQVLLRLFDTDVMRVRARTLFLK